MENFEKDVIERLTKIETEIANLTNVTSKVHRTSSEVDILRIEVDELKRVNQWLKTTTTSIVVALVIAYIKWILKI